MEIQNFITEPIFNETISKLKTKAKDETKRTFSELFDKGKEQSASVTSNLPENFSTDNAVKSTLFLGSLETQREHNASSMTTIKLSESEKIHGTTANCLKA